MDAIRIRWELKPNAAPTRSTSPAGRTSTLIGIHFHAGGISTNASSHHLLLKELKGQYVGHSYVHDVSGKASVLVKGHHIELNSCELAYASGSLLRMEGHDNRMINCYLHHGDYAGKWNGVASFSGRRHVISHNTIRHSGRDVCSVHGLMESLIQHNDLSHAGHLTADLGMTYGHNTDFMGTVIRYNWVHDNLAHGHTAGIYFDHCSHNAIVHHNVVWNIPSMPLQVNNPSYFMLCYNNTLWNSGRISTFDHSHRDDMFGCRFQNNISAGEFRLPEHVVTEPNLIDAGPGIRRSGVTPFRPSRRIRRHAARAFRSRALRLPTRGSPPTWEPGDSAWKAGHDFQKPPEVCTGYPAGGVQQCHTQRSFRTGHPGMLDRERRRQSGTGCRQWLGKRVRTWRGPEDRHVETRVEVDRQRVAWNRLSATCIPIPHISCPAG